MSGLLSRMYERIRSSSSARSRASSAWALSSSPSSRISICAASKSILIVSHAPHQRERESAAGRFPCDRANIRQGHPPGVRRVGALIPWDGLSSTGGLSSAPLSTASAPGGNVAVLDMLTVT